MKTKKTFFYRACVGALAVGAAAITLLPAATHAQIPICSVTNFVDEPVGPYGAVQDFQGGESLTSSNVAPGDVPTDQAWEVAFNPGPNINFQTTSAAYPAAGNTNTSLSAYTLEFDMQVTGSNVSLASGLQISIFPNEVPPPSGYDVFGANLLLKTFTNVFVAGVGYQHYSIPLSDFQNNGFITTATNFSLGIGYVSYPAGIPSATREIFDIANVQITMNELSPPTPNNVSIWWTTNFFDDPLGPYGSAVDFQGGENLAVNIVSPGEWGGIDQAMEITFTPAANINFQTCTLAYPTSGQNTNTSLLAYTLEFDMQVTGNNLAPANGLQLSLFANEPGSGYNVFGANMLLPSTDTNVFVAGAGYQHYSIPLVHFNNNGFTVNGTNFSLGIGYVSYPANITAATETIDVDNVQIVMLTNKVAPPSPKLMIQPAKAGVRIFGKNYQATYNQEGFGTLDGNQQWAGVATAANPVTYKVNIGDFDTVNNYTLYVQLLESAVAPITINPNVAYEGANSLVWSITSHGGASGFTTSIDWKTNSPAEGVPGTDPNNNYASVNALALTTTSLNGRGLWTLTFTSDTAGSVTAPDGTTGSFSLDPYAVATYFTGNPVTILYGTAPNNTAGFGQYIDIAAITNSGVSGVNEADDFRIDGGLDTTNTWSTAFSDDAGSVFQVNTNQAYWLAWTGPEVGFAPATKAVLNSNIPWYSLGYYSNGATNAPTGQEGPTWIWELVNYASLPTVNGLTNGAPGAIPSPNQSFFRMSYPAPNP